MENLENPNEQLVEKEKKLIEKMSEVNSAEDLRKIYQGAKDQSGYAGTYENWLDEVEKLLGF